MSLKICIYIYPKSLRNGCDLRNLDFLWPLKASVHSSVAVCCAVYTHTCLAHCLLPGCPSSMQKEILLTSEGPPAKGARKSPRAMSVSGLSLQPLPPAPAFFSPFLHLLLVITCWECKYIPCWGCCSRKLKVTAPGDTRMVLDVGSWAEVGREDLSSAHVSHCHSPSAH